MDKCPQCGYSEVKTLKKFTHEMSEYVNPRTGKVDGVYNTADETLIVQPKGSKEQVELVRKDVYEKEVKRRESEKLKKQQEANVGGNTPVAPVTAPAVTIPVAPVPNTPALKIDTTTSKVVPVEPTKPLLTS